MNIVQNFYILCQYGFEFWSKHNSFLMEYCSSSQDRMTKLRIALCCYYSSSSAMFNLRPIGRAWPKGSCDSAKCTLTTEKSIDTFNKITKFQQHEHWLQYSLQSKILVIAPNIRKYSLSWIAINGNSHYLKNA